MGMKGYGGNPNPRSVFAGPGKEIKPQRVIPLDKADFREFEKGSLSPQEYRTPRFSMKPNAVQGRIWLSRRKRGNT